MSDIESLASSISDLSQHSGAPQLLSARSSHEETNKNEKKSLDASEKNIPKEGLESPGLPRRLIEEKTAASAELSAVRVPRSERRGILSSIAIMPEIQDARNYRTHQKLTIVCIIAFAALAAPMSTAILLPAVEDLSHDLKAPISMVNISIGIYLVSLGIFPMWWSSFSEKHGRRSVYVISFTWFFVFSVACAVAPDIISLIVLRLLAGIGASAMQACGAGTISDLYIQEERGTALGLFYLGPLLGPFISPVLGGAVAQAWGWRATMWTMVIMCGINVVLIVLLLPETLPRNNDEIMKTMIQKASEKALNSSEDSLEKVPSNVSRSTSLRRQLDEEAAIDTVMPTLLRVLTNQTSYSCRIREQDLPDSIMEDKTWQALCYDYTLRPVHAVVLLTYPPVLLAIIYSSTIFMGIYFFNITISNQYSQAPYNFPSTTIGLLYIPNSFAFILTSIYGGKWCDWLIKRSARLHNGELVPESRISWNIVLAAAIVPCACMIFGWCLDKKQHWVTPLVGSVMYGFGSMLVTGTIVTYLADVLPGKGATGMALNNLVRQILAAVASFITAPVTQALGPGVLFCIYAGLVSVAGLSAWLLKRNGAHWREKYDVSMYYAKL